jgi:hypothetical protein
MEDFGNTLRVLCPRRTESAMKLRKSGMIAGSCRQCHSDVQLANGIYFCQCGSASDKSYYFPPNWVFKLSQTSDPLVNRAAKAASSGKQIG